MSKVCFVLCERSELEYQRELFAPKVAQGSFQHLKKSLKKLNEQEKSQSHKKNHIIYHL